LENRSLGWEGSQDSTYVISHARFLFDMGVSIFRLNYRDHGPTHHLNEGAFNSTLFNEIFDAVRQISEGASVPAYLIGFSLGGLRPMIYWSAAHRLV